MKKKTWYDKLPSNEAEYKKLWKGTKFRRIDSWYQNELYENVYCAVKPETKEVVKAQIKDS